MPTKEIIVLIIFLAVISSVYFTEAALIGICAYNKLRSRYRPNILLRKKFIMLHIAAVIIILCMCYGYFIEPYRLEVNMINIKTSKLNQTGFRIVHISDLHCDKKPVNEKKMVEIVNGLEPDIIVFTGDAVNRPSALGFFKETMKGLDAPLGKFAVYGNWETNHWPGLDYYSQTGFEILDVRNVRLEKNGEKITVSGISSDNSKSSWKIYQNLSNEEYNVFLFHYPDFIGYIDDFYIDLYLCGHTHGGQIALPFYGAVITMSKLGKKYEAGLYSVGDTAVYVNRGLGMDAFPGPKMRFFARPEITVFDIGPVN